MKKIDSTQAKSDSNKQDIEPTMKTNTNISTNICPENVNTSDKRSKGAYPKDTPSYKRGTERVPAVEVIASKDKYVFKNPGRKQERDTRPSEPNNQDKKSTLNIMAPEYYPAVGSNQNQSGINIKYKMKPHQVKCKFCTPHSVCLNGIHCPYIHDYTTFNVPLYLDYIVGSISRQGKDIEIMTELLGVLIETIRISNKDNISEASGTTTKPQRSRSRDEAAVRSRQKRASTPGFDRIQKK